MTGPSVGTRLLHVISAYPPSRGGAQVHAQMLARQQVAEGDHVHVATIWRSTRKDWLRGTTVGAPAPAAAITEPDGVTVHQCGFERGARRAALLPALTYYPAMRTSAPHLTKLYRAQAEAVIDAARPDVAHFSRIGREGFYQSFADVLAERGIPWVLTPNHHPHWVRRRDRWWWDLYRTAGAVLVFSESEAAAVAAGGVDAERIVRTVVGPVGVDPSDAVPPPADASVLFLGQVRAYKGLAALAEAIRIVRREGTDVTLDVVGPWVDPMPSLRRRLEGEPHVRVHGSLDDEAKRRMLTAAAVVCVPSTEEALGGVHLEAWAARRPTIGADIAPVRELFEATGGGLAVPPDPDGVAAGLRRVLGDPGFARRLADAGHEAVRTRFNWTVAAHRARDAYRIASGAAPGPEEGFA